MSADNKRFVRYDLDDHEAFQAYLDQLDEFKKALTGSLFSSQWGRRGPRVTFLDATRHIPLSAHGVYSSSAGDKVYDPSQGVPASVDPRVIAVDSDTVEARYKAEVYDYVIERNLAGGVIRADAWVWRTTSNGIGLYRVYIKGTGESRVVMGDEVMVDRYLGDERLGPLKTTYNMLEEFTYSPDKTPSHHWEPLALRPQYQADRDETGEVVGSAFLAMVATIGVEPIHTPALKRALINVLDSCG